MPNRSFRYVKGEPNEKCISEVKQAIEKAYPVEKRKVFISLKNILYEILDNPDKYPLVSGIQPDMYRKSVLTYIFKNDLKWKVHSVAKGVGRKNGAVFIRGEL